MTNRLDVTTSGDALGRRLDTIAANLDDLSAADDAAADLLAAAARTRAPRRTGLLRSRIRSTGAGRVVADLPYAVVVHNGWRARRIRARPFARDAVTATRDDVTRVYVDHVTDTLNR